MKIVITIMLLLLFNNSYSQTNQELKEIVETYRTKYKVPAIATAIVKYDTIFYATSGVKKTGEEDKIDPFSKFHLGSNTKAITSFIAALLVEKGIIEWNTKLIDVLPSLKSDIHPAYLNITLEDLLAHRAKIAPFEDDNSKEWRKMPTDKINRATNQKLEFAQYALSLEPSEFEDTNHLYSNGGYIIAALILETCSKKKWESLIEELFDTIGVSHYVGFPSQSDTAETYGHIKKGRKYKYVPPHKEYHLGQYFSPAGNLSLSLQGFSLFIQLNLKGLMGEKNLLTPESYQKLHFGLDKYSLGWYNGKIGNTSQKFSYHGGSLGTFSSAIIISADRKIAIIILVNADNDYVNKLKNELRVELWDKYSKVRS